MLVVVDGSAALQAASPVPVLHTSFAPVPPAIDVYTQPVNAEQWQCSSRPFVTQYAVCTPPAPGSPAPRMSSGVSPRLLPTSFSSLAGLMTAADPDASAASTPPAGIATGKFHGGVTTVTFDGTNSAPVIFSRSRARSA